MTPEWRGKAEGGRATPGQTLLCAALPPPSGTRRGPGREGKGGWSRQSPTAGAGRVGPSPSASPPSLPPHPGATVSQAAWPGASSAQRDPLHRHNTSSDDPSLLKFTTGKGQPSFPSQSLPPTTRGVLSPALLRELRGVPAGLAGTGQSQVELRVRLAPTELLLAKAEPSRKAGGTSGTTYLRKRKIAAQLL